MDAKPNASEYDQVREDLRLLREDFAKLAKSVADHQSVNISGFREEMLKEAREALQKVRQTGDDALNSARDAGEKAVLGVEHKIEERPFLSVVIMFLAGLLVGKLLDR